MICYFKLHWYARSMLHSKITLFWQAPPLWWKFHDCISQTSQMHFPTGNWHQKVASPGKQQHSLLSGENFTIVFPKRHKCKSNWQAAPSSTYCSLVKISPLYFPNFTNANATGKRHQAAQVALWWKFHQEIPEQVWGRAGQQCPDQYGRVKESSPTKQGSAKTEIDAKCKMDRICIIVIIK